MTTQLEVIACARTWMGTPWRHQACVKGEGVDCAHLVIGVCRELGLVAKTFDISGYSRIPDGKSLIAECVNHMDPVQDVADIQLADVAIFRIKNAPQHVTLIGDYVHGGFSIIHAMDMPGGTGKVVETTLDSSMRRRLVGLFRLRGVTA